jgi:hypothetical protein
MAAKSTPCTGRRQDHQEERPRMSHPSTRKQSVVWHDPAEMPLDIRVIMKPLFAMGCRLARSGIVDGRCPDFPERSVGRSVLANRE